MKKIFLILVYLLLLPSLSWGATYYIDPTFTTNGDGTLTSEAASTGDPGAYNTWVGITLARGNSYLQKGGSTYRSNVTIPATAGTDRIIIGSYGTGKAVITARKRLSTTGWTDEGGGVYSIAISSTYDAKVFWAGVAGSEWGTETAQDTATPGTPAAGKWGWVGGATDKLYYHPASAQPIPGDAGAIFEYAMTDGLMALAVNTGYITIQDLHLTRAAREGLFVWSTVGALNGVIVQRLLTDYNKNFTESARIGNGIEIGQYVNGAIIDYCESSYNGDHGVAIEASSGTPKPANCIISNSYFHHNESCGGTIRGELGKPSHATYLNNQVEYNGTGHGSAVATNGESGIKLLYGYGTLSKNTIQNNAGAGVWACLKTYDASNNGMSADISYNLITGNGTATNFASHSTTDDGGIYFRGEYNKGNGGTDGTISIYNNTIVNTGRAAIWFGDTAQAGIVNIDNNIMRQGTFANLILTSFAAATVSVSNNMYDTTPSECVIRTSAGDYHSNDLTNWNAVSGNLTVGTDSYSDPIFTSSTNFHLLPGSPAINAGVDVGLTQDIEGNSIPYGAAPDIGAYEYRPKHFWNF